MVDAEDRSNFGIVCCERGERTPFFRWGLRARNVYKHILSTAKMGSSESAGEPSAAERAELEALFRKSRSDLKRLVNAKLDRRLSGRIDSSDVVQEAYLEACRRYKEYLNNPEVPLVEWLRFLTMQVVQATHRFHLGRQKRSVEKEVAVHSDVGVVQIVDIISGSLDSPHSVLVRSELQKVVSRLLSAMSEPDQEIIKLRHLEQLSNAQCAERMGISVSAASKRYIRAIERLRFLANDFLQ